MESVLSFRVWVSRQLWLRNFQLIVLLLSILIASTKCSESLCAELQPLCSRRPHDKHYSSNRLQRDAHVLALGNYGVAAAEERRLATPAIDHKVVRRSTRNVSSKEVRAKLNGTTPPDREVEALTAFKAAISRDPLNALRSWNVRSGTNDSDVCSSWAGVTCSAQYPYHVVTLTVPDLLLAGNLDSVMVEFTQLQFLQRLDLSNNLFTGFINGGSLTNFSHLSYFNVSHNSLTGEIPSEVGELVSLQDLDVTANNLFGLIPSLANCSLLRVINFGRNFLHGNIPPWLGKLSSLTNLVLTANSLSGNIPSELGNCSSLRTLELSDNYFLGPVLPQELSQLQQLQILQASSCSLGGSLPIWIGNLTSMRGLSLSYNRFKGEIPETIGQLQLLNVLYLGGNLLTAFPLSVFNCTLLVQLTLEYNQLLGHIPQEVGLLTNLEVLTFAENNLTGVIPSSLDNCSAVVDLELGLNLEMDPQPFPSWIGTHTNLGVLYLESMNLQGEFPEFIGNFSNLQELTLGGNNLYGNIPTSLKNCVFLGILDLHGNNLTGNIPSDLGLLSYMTYFYVDGNQLTGSFPAFFVNWTQLSVFQVSQNLLSGMLEVPATVGNSNQLQLFDAADNDFVGPIPETLGNSSSIAQLLLYDNRLSGAIPRWLVNMTSLQQLVLQNNRLEGKIPVELFRFDHQFGLLSLSLNLLDGSIPAEIGQLSGLTYLDLSHNNFNGTIPSSLGNCSKMNLLDLSHNHFEGNIPASAIAAMFASLISLNLSSNSFSGLWPREFSKLLSVHVINVSANYLSGSIPLGLGNCLSLQSLDMSMNRFTGEIPQDLGSLSTLQFFNASFNDFEGSIPQMGIFMNRSRINGDSFLGNPALCGPADIVGPNHQQCAVAPTNVSSHARRHGSCEGFKCTNVWILVTAAVISSISLLVVFIVTGIKLRWTFSRGSRNMDGDEGVIINFTTHLRFTESDVLRTINDPSKGNIIGGGASSIVFKGIQPEGVEFALKKVLPAVGAAGSTGSRDDGDSNHPEREPAKEAEALANLRHRNILKCLAFYSKLDLRALILEYLCEGSLHEHLHGGRERKLTWETRLKIAMGVAQGLLYLHHDFPEPIIHRDLKPSNILLDADLEPKIGDFGISKYVNPLRDGQATASTFCGTIGYMPPEYSSSPLVSTKGDVYSYGMVLLEILTGTQPSLMADLGDDSQDLRTRVLNHFHEKSFELLDPYLLEECSSDNKAMEQIMLLLRVSLFCTRLAPRSRPSMTNVMGMLMFIANFAVEPVNTRTVEELANDMDPKIWSSEDPAGEGA